MNNMLLNKFNEKHNDLKECKKLLMALSNKLDNLSNVQLKNNQTKYNQSKNSQILPGSAQDENYYK